MRGFLLFTVCLALLPIAPASAQTQKLTREAPMGERTPLFGSYLYESANKNVTFPYYLLGPDKAQPGVKYPLIVVLHGRSGHAYGAWVLAKKVVKEDMPAFVMVPMMTEDAVDWTADSFRKKDWQNSRPMDHVAILTRSLTAQLPIDPDRIYITGYSMGGVGTFGMIEAFPDLFAAAVPICGAWYPDQGAKFVNIPIWAFHGTDDRSVPVQQTRDIINAIKKAGGSPKYTEYPGVDHNSWINAYNEPELWLWLLGQKKAR